MGLSISTLFHYIFGKENARILMIGLDGAGKTTILYQLKIGEVVTTIPTIGFNVETVEYKNIKFTVWDIGGQNRIRSLWHHYYVNTSAVIFVVDSTDEQRLPEAAEDLHCMMEHDELRDAVLLVCANKQDLPNAVSPTEMAQRLALKSVKQDWHIHGISATQGQGVFDSLEYLREMLAKRRKAGKAGY